MSDTKTMSEQDVVNAYQKCIQYLRENVERERFILFCAEDQAQQKPTSLVTFNLVDSNQAFLYYETRDRS